MLIPKSFGLLFLLIGFHFILFSQNIDDNKPALTKKEKQVLEWCDEAFSLRFTNPDEARAKALLADSLATVIGFIRGQGEAKVIQGILAKNNKQYQSAKEFYLAAKDLRESIKDIEGIASCYNNLGNIDWEQYQYKLAIENYTAGITLLNDHRQYVRLLGPLFSNLAMAYNDNGIYSLAAQHVDSSIIIANDFGDTLRLAYFKLNAGIIFNNQGFLNKARTEFEESLPIFQQYGDLNGILKYLINISMLNHKEGKYKEALKQLQEALPHAASLSKFDRFSLYKNLGAILQTTGESVDSSLYYFNTALDNIGNQPLQKDNADIHYHIGRLYFQQNKYNQSIVHLEQSDRLLDSLVSPALQMNVLYKLSESYARVNQFEKAYYYGNLSTLLQDSLNQINEKAMEYKLNYEMVKKDSQIKSEQYKQQRIINIAILISILTAVFLWFRNRFRRREMQQKIDDMLKDQEIKALQAKLEGQDQEQMRIGQDLHDRLGVMLSTIKLYFQSVEEKIETARLEKVDQFQKATELLDEACEEVRNIAHDMQTNTLVQFGLQEELKDLVETLKDAQRIEVTLSTFGLEKRLNSQLEIKVYKIIQELIANALKHAKASSLNIGVSQFEKLINIIVQDDGRGFELDKLDLYEGTGLRNIEARVLDLQGKVSIDSNLGKGTTISIDIPHQEKTS